MAEIQARPIAPVAQIKDFLQFLYSTTEGYVYIPLKKSVYVPSLRRSVNFHQYFFKWPDQQEDIINHIVNNFSSADVYISPVLYKHDKNLYFTEEGKVKNNSAIKANVLGSHVLWAEVDDVSHSETRLQGLPGPSRRVLTSNGSSGRHEHWYWSLDALCGDVGALEGVTKALTYHLECDYGWAVNKILRPPCTKNHKYPNTWVLPDKIEDTSYKLSEFNSIPSVDTVVDDLPERTKLPDITMVMALHKWELEDFMLFRKQYKEDFSRHRAMYRLAIGCAESGMSDASILSVLYNVDDRWKKFHGREDQHRQLVGVINAARQRLTRKEQENKESNTLQKGEEERKQEQEPQQEQQEEELLVYNYDQFLKADIQVEWEIEGLIEKLGILLMMGPPGTGKSQLSMRFAINMALGKDYLGYHIPKPRKIAFFSLEMSHPQVDAFLRTMSKDFNEEEKQVLRENLLIVPVGESLPLNNLSSQVKYLKFLDKYQPNGVILDSMGYAVGGNYNGQVDISQQVMQSLQRVNKQYGIFTWGTHHPRKAQVGNKKPNTQDDLDGSGWYSRIANSILVIWKENPGDPRSLIEVKEEKNRLKLQKDQYKVKRTDTLDFIKVEDSATDASLLQALNNVVKDQGIEL